MSSFPRRRRAKPSSRRVDEGRLDSFTPDYSARVDQGGLNVFGLEVRVMLQNRFRSRTGRKQAENVLDGDAHAANDRLAAEDFWVDCDALEEIGVAHDA